MNNFYLIFFQKKNFLLIHINQHEEQAYNLLLKHLIKFLFKIVDKLLKMWIIINC